MRWPVKERTGERALELHGNRKHKSPDVGGSFCAWGLARRSIEVGWVKGSDVADELGEVGGARLHSALQAARSSIFMNMELCPRYGLVKKTLFQTVWVEISPLCTTIYSFSYVSTDIVKNWGVYSVKY